MKLVTFESDQGPEAGVVVNEHVVGLSQASGGQLPDSLIELLADDSAVEEAGCLSEKIAASEQLARENGVHSLQDVRLLAPVPRPGKVVCLGLNYRDHADESGAEVPEEPVVFSKARTSVIGPKEPICLPRVSHEVDYEVELAVVIGRNARNIPATHALDFVAGYTIICDVSARDYQHDKPGGQWFLGKSFDTFCPMGPWIVLREEVSDPHDLDLSCEVNGETLQASNTGQMIFPVPEIIAYLSQVFTLETGDIVATGTPSGVGAARTPPRWLQSGDRVRCRISGVGALENPVT